jgi:hypothetical protein
VAALLIVGVVALGWFAFNVPAMIGTFGALAIVLVGPCGLIALLTLAGAFGLRTGRAWAPPVGIAGSVIAIVWVGFIIGQYWPYLLISLVDPGVSYNWALPEVWIPLPIVAGGIVALVALLRGDARRPVESGGPPPA